MEIKILDIRKSTFSAGLTLAYLQLQIDNLTIDGFKIVNGKNGKFLSYPREKGKDDIWRDIVKPVDVNIKQEIENFVLKAFDNYLNNEIPTKLPPEG